MDELIRNALLGDRYSQDKCTEKGIALPCVHGIDCNVFSSEVDGKIVYRVISKTCCCFQGPVSFTEKQAISDWNRRPAPPIVSCEECKYGEDGTCEFAEAGFFC